MPIYGLSDRGLKFPEIGQVRKGAKKTENAPGRDLTYFRIELDAMETEALTTLVKTYGTQPQEINIILPFNDIEQCWSAWLEAYTAGRMVARSDGQFYTYRLDAKGQQMFTPDHKIPYVPGETVATWQDSKGKTQKVTCKPVGRLKIIIPELRRLAYLVVMTSSIHDIINISGQLESLKTINGGVIAGIPMVLRRRPKKISTPKPDGTRARYEKWLLSIEADPQWVKSKLSQLKYSALPGNGFKMLPEGEHEDVIESEVVEDEVDDELPEDVEEEQEAAPVQTSKVQPVAVEITQKIIDAEMSSDGQTLYTSIPTAKLSGMGNAMLRKLNAGEYTADELIEKSRKLAVIDAILISRQEAGQ